MPPTERGEKRQALRSLAAGYAGPLITARDADVAGWAQALARRSA